MSKYKHCKKCGIAYINYEDPNKCPRCDGNLARDLRRHINYNKKLEEKFKKEDRNAKP